MNITVECGTTVNNVKTEQRKMLIHAALHVDNISLLAKLQYKTKLGRKIYLVFWANELIDELRAAKLVRYFPSCNAHNKDDEVSLIPGPWTLIYMSNVRGRNIQ